MVGHFFDNYLLAAVLGYVAVLVTQAQNPPECAVGETYVFHENTRGPIICPSGFILDGSECISELSNITGIVTGAFSQFVSSKMKHNLHLDHFLQETRLMDKICKILDTFNITYQNLNVTVDIKHDNKTFTITNRIHCNCDFSMLHFADSLAAKFENAVTYQIRAVTTEFYCHVTLVLIILELRWILI